jgi:hypothetical protein
MASHGIGAHQDQAIEVDRLTNTHKAFLSGRLDTILEQIERWNGPKLGKPESALDLIATPAPNPHAARHILYSWGVGFDFQLGFLKDKQKWPKPVEIAEEIVHLDTDKFHTLAVGRSGAVYSFGNGMHGRLGFGNVENVVTPTLLRFPKDVKAIRAVAVSENHSLALTDTG